MQSFGTYLAHHHCWRLGSLMLSRSLQYLIVRYSSLVPKLLISDILSLEEAFCSDK